MPRRGTPPTHTIDGDSFVFGYLQTSEAAELSAEALGLIAPVVATAFQGLDPEALDEQIQDILRRMDLRAVAEVFTRSADPKKVARLIRRLCAPVVAAGAGRLEDDGIYEAHFAGRPLVALQVAVKSLEVNGGLAFFGLVASAKSRPKTALTPEKTGSIG